MPDPTLTYATPTPILRMNLLAIGALILAMHAAFNLWLELWGRHWLVNWLLILFGMRGLSAWFFVAELMPMVVGSALLVAAILMLCRVIPRDRAIRGSRWKVFLCVETMALYLLVTLASLTFVQYRLYQGAGFSFMASPTVTIMQGTIDFLLLMLMLAGLLFTRHVGLKVGNRAISIVSVYGMGLSLLAASIVFGFLEFPLILRLMNWDADWIAELFPEQDRPVAIVGYALSLISWSVVAVTAWRMRRADRRVPAEGIA